MCYVLQSNVSFCLILIANIFVHSLTGGGPLSLPWFYDIAFDTIGERSHLFDGVQVPGKLFL